MSPLGKSGFLVNMKEKERYQIVLNRFEVEMPSPQTELHYANPYQLLVAVILSAQCTDKRVNIITPPLFAAFPTPADLAAATPEQVFELIKSCSYPNNKTKSLIGMAKRLVDEYEGNVPDDIDSLLTIPGVGRKTANVILSVIYNKPTMAVDTSCIPCGRAHRPYNTQPYTQGCRRETYRKYPGRSNTASPPLADTAWALRMQSA